MRLQTDWMLWQLVPTGVGIKTGRDQEKILLKVSLSIGLYLHITVDSLSTIMFQKRRMTSCMSIHDLQGLDEGEIMDMRGTMETTNSR